jgi:tRNA(Phe) wybutosine-synthesizing methylase Tyw3
MMLNSPHRRRQNFANSKIQCLSKRDKSFAGRIDAKAVEICSVINDREEYYTTSSCSGRCFLYQGSGVKATDSFRRFRICHGKVNDSRRYFDLATLDADPTGGGDPMRSIGQFDHAEKVRQISNDQGQLVVDNDTRDNSNEEESDTRPSSVSSNVIWLRFEPFILHVACRSLSAASAMMNAARPAFKNVGLTTWKDDQSTNDSSNFAKYLVAIWGDEGLDMPLCTPEGSHVFSEAHEWLAALVNERHQRNWEKIDRFVQATRAMSERVDINDDDDDNEQAENIPGNRAPKSFDVLGDVAVLNILPQGDQEELARIGEEIMQKNKAIKVREGVCFVLKSSENSAVTSLTNLVQYV